MRIAALPLCFAIAPALIACAKPPPAYEIVVGVEAAKSEETMKVLAARVDDIRGAEVARVDADSIAIRLPKDVDVAREKRVLMQRGAFELTLVDDTVNPWRGLVLPDGATEESSGFQNRDGSYVTDAFVVFPREREAAMRTFFVDNKLDRVKVGPFEHREDDGMLRTYWMSGAPAITNAHVLKANALFDDVHMMRPYVRVRLTSEGKSTFAAFTEKATGKRLAILVDDVVTSAPVIVEPISGGVLMVTLAHDASIKNDKAAQMAEVEELARVLEAGALPAAVTIESERAL